MAKLNDTHKTFIVQAQACWDRPSQVSDAVKEEFGLDMPRSRGDGGTIYGMRASLAAAQDLYRQKRG